MMKRTIVCLSLLLAASWTGIVSAAEPNAPAQQQFQELVQKVQKDGAGVSEGQVERMIELSEELGQPYTAFVAVKSHLARNLSPSPSLLNAAAENAFLAGEYRTAVARYKAYLRAANGDKETAEAAGRLYTILIDFVRAGDDAYLFMKQFGSRYRNSIEARKFDGWFLDQARRRDDVPAHAMRLAEVFGDKLPVEQERLYFWSELDWLMNQLSQARSDDFDALADARELAAGLRADKQRSLRFDFIVKHLAYHATAAGKAQETMTRDFQEVVAAAKSYFNAYPTAETLREICEVFAGGIGKFDGKHWNEQRDQKHAFFVEAFSKLSDAHKRKMIGWRWQYTATPEQWVELAAKSPKVFQSDAGTAEMQFQYRAADPEIQKKQSTFLTGVPSREAAVVNSLAAGGEDLNKVATHLGEKESWHLQFADVYDLLSNHIWPTYRSNPQHENVPGEAFATMMVTHFGPKYVAGSPLGLFDPGAAGAYMTYAFRHSGEDGNDKSAVAEHLHSLDWIPYTEKQLREVYGQAYEEFKKWAGGLRKQAKDDKVDDAVLEQITPLEEAFQSVLKRTEPDLSKAPDDLAKRLAEAVLAVRDSNQDDLVAASRDLYQKVREFDTKHTPFGRATVDYILQYRQGFDILDFQAEVIRDQVPRYRPDGDNRWIDHMMDVIVRRRSGWDWFRIHRNEQTFAVKLNHAFADGMRALLKSEKFWPQAFNWFRGTRRGHGWKDYDLNGDVLATMIEKDVLAGTDWRPAGSDWPFRSTNYMWLIHNEFRGISKQYPPERYFDDMFVEEARATGTLDWRYWHYGRDENRKVAAVGARTIAGWERLPLGYGDQEIPAIRADWIWDWHTRSLNAPAEVRDEMIRRIEARYGKTRYDSYAMGRAYFTAKAGVNRPENRKEFFEKIDAYLSKAAEAPERVMPPYMAAIQQIEAPAEMTEPEIAALKRVFDDAVPDRWPGGWSFEAMVLALQDGLVAHDRADELFPLVPHFWKVAADTGDAAYQRSLMQRARALLGEEEHDLASVFASAGLDIVGTQLSEDTRSNLLAVQSKSMLNISGVIPVDRADPRYPIYAAQAAYLTGRQEQAWKQYLDHRGAVHSTFKDLDSSFVIWLIDKNAETRNFEEAESLAREMMQWVDSNAGSFEPGVRADLQMAYASIAFARQEYPRARAWYERISASQEFDGTQAHRDAQLRIAEIYRLTNQYDQAIQMLEKLARRGDAYLQTQASYQLARTHYDLEQYVESRNYLEQVFARMPNHPDARILEGKVFLELKKLEQATDLPVGLQASERYLVPGRPLKVSMEDRNLSIVGKSSSVEIRAWTASGDEETFVLLPFGDSKTKFAGQVGTAMAPVQKGDHTLQVLGGDTIHYDFSETFKAANKLAAHTPAELTVVTDAELYVSSGRILTEQERELRAMEQQILQRIRLHERENAPQRSTALSTVRPENQIKPGNPVNIRVVDPDQATTAEADQLTVRVTASSGDRLDHFVLKETESHSGVFEGSVATATGQATAYASDSDEGREANFVISAGEHPAWVALPDNSRPKLFSVDLNDNVGLGEMTINADVPGRKLKQFVVQVSPNGRDFRTIGGWPESPEAWDGSPRLELVRFGNAKRAPSNVLQFQKYLEQGHLKDGFPEVVLNPSKLAESFNRDVNGHADAMKLDWKGNGSWYLAHYKAAFYQPEKQVRMFQIDHKNRLGNIRYFLLVDGKAGENPYRVKRPLTQGVHTIDIYMAAYRHADPKFELMCDSEEPPYVKPCPPEMFDPREHPEIRRAIYAEPAEVASNEAHSQFTVDFGPETRARVIRLFIQDFETDAPAINRIKLTDRDGQRILPTEQNLLALKENSTLEIVPGDRVTVMYRDPSVITKEREIHEESLTATFHNADVSACFVEYDRDRDGNRVPRYVPMRRFKPGDRINIYINDPDGDESDERDKLSFTVRTYDGEPHELVALETDPHSGIFIGTVFPVEAEPQRDSEVKVAEGDDLVITYLDRENTDPGIPWERTFVVEQSWVMAPELRVYDVTSRPLTESELEAVEASEEGDRRVQEHVPVTRSMIASRPMEAMREKPAEVLIDGPLLVELTYPMIAQSPESTTEIYVQTAAGREQFGRELKDGEFDVNVPGTIKVRMPPSDPGSVPAPRGYRDVLIRSNPYASAPLDDGRFSFAIPMELGEVPEETLIHEQMSEELAYRTTGYHGRRVYDRVYDRVRTVYGRVTAASGYEERRPLAIRGNDTVYVGFQYTEPPSGEQRWIVKKVELASDVFFHVMDRKYFETLDGVHVGEKVYLRVIDKVRDTTNDKDELELAVRTSSGEQRPRKLTETFGHSGVFKGVVQLAFAGDADAADGFGVMPVQYGDSVIAMYQRREPMDEKTEFVNSLTVFKGADGTVIPFTKRFEDPSIAVQTQFTIAEAYFELAKRHRDLGEVSLARREIAQGKKLLEEAVRDYPDTDARAQADYLLANLSLEFANDAVNDDVKKDFYMEAVSRFSDIVATYPDSDYAPKAQYKKALVFEKMGQIDLACEEYVKLSYRYPDNELVAETIARLGQYFLTKGRSMEEEAGAETELVEREKQLMQAREMFKTAAEVFGRLAERFPNHRLSGKTTVLSAQCYMRADLLERAIEVFTKVIEDPEQDNDLIAESMYWAGDCNMKQRDHTNAYRQFKKLTWDYPESKWAKFARGRLTDENLAKVEEAEAAASGY